MKSSISAAFSLVFLLLACALGALYYVKAEWTPPTLSLTPEHTRVSAKTIFTVGAADQESGLRSLQIVATQGGKNVDIVSKTLPEGMAELREEFSIPRTGLSNGPLTLTVTVKDASWHRFGHGNRAQIVRELDIDSKPPVVSVLSGQHYVNQDRKSVV